MAIENPEYAPGPTLRAYRELHGVERTALAKRLGRHRNTVLDWEGPSRLIDATRATQYRMAVDAIVRDRLGDHA